MKNLKVVGIIAGVLVVGCVIAVTIIFRPASPSTPPAEPPPNIDELRPKAEAGNAEAQTKLGRAYAKGTGVPQDYKQAAEWYRKAAEQNYPMAQTALGELYEAGRGVARDDAEAAAWYRKAAEKGYAPGQYALAVLYVVGRGVPQNDVEAMKWYRLAAEQNDALAQFNLGMRYYEAHGVAPDPSEAFKWLSLAAAQGLEDAARARDTLKRSMTSEQVKEGKRRAAAFVPAGPRPQ